MAIPKDEQRDIPEEQDFQGDDAESFAEEEEEQAPPPRPRFQRPASSGGPRRTPSRGGGFRRGGGGGGSRGASQSNLQRVTGLYENENGSFSGRTKDDKEVETDNGVLFIPGGLKFMVMENQYARTSKDPTHVLLVVAHEDESYQGRRGGGRR